MKVYRSLDELGPIKNAVVTTGSFDGVHVGHKMIIRRLESLAREINGESILITFYPHPRKVLYPDAEGKDLKMIYSQEEKIRLLAETGLDHLLIIPFTLDFSRTTSSDFVQNILVGLLHARVIVVGFNHYFGYNREGTYDFLYNLGNQAGFNVEEIPEQEIQNETVSSTKIRRSLLEGNIQRANAYLDHFYFIHGSVLPGNRNLQATGFDTYQIEPGEADKLIPPGGVYAIRLRSGASICRGMASIREDTDSAPGPLIEFHLFEKPAKLTESAEGTLYFHKRIRDLMQFRSLEELKDQLAADKVVIGEMIY